MSFSIFQLFLSLLISLSFFFVFSVFFVLVFTYFLSFCAFSHGDRLAAKNDHNNKRRRGGERLCVKQFLGSRVVERKESEENRRPRRVQRFARVELEGDVAHRTVVRGVKKRLLIAEDSEGWRHHRVGRRGGARRRWQRSR